MDLSGMASARPAVAVDTKLEYAEIDLGALSATSQSWTAPYVSDWAIAVGDFRLKQTYISNPSITPPIPADIRRRRNIPIPTGMPIYRKATFLASKEPRQRLESQRRTCFHLAPARLQSNCRRLNKYWPKAAMP